MYYLNEIGIKSVLEQGHNLIDPMFFSEEYQNTLVELTLESETYLKAEERKMINNTHHGIVHLIPKVKNQK